MTPKGPTSRQIIASTANLDGKPPASGAKIGRNVHAVGTAPGNEDFIGWTESWSTAAPRAVRAEFPGHRLIRPRKPYGAGMSVMQSWKPGYWHLGATAAIQVSDPLWYRGRLLSDARYLLTARYHDDDGHDLLVMTGHHNPDGTWAGEGALRVTQPARKEAVSITRSVIARGGAPALWLGDPNLGGAFLGTTITRQNRVCLTHHVGAGRVDRAVFIDGITAKWSKVQGSRSPYPANPGHPLGWLRTRGTVTWP